MISKRKLKKSLFCILILVILYTFVWPWATTLQFGETDANLTIAFKGAGKGLDPQGNRFDINLLKSDEVLRTAIKESGMEDRVSAEELKKRVFILPQAEADTLKELLSLTTITGKTQDIKERMVYPTSYTVGLKDMGVPSYFDDKKLLMNILQVYKAQLKSRYLSDTLSEPAYTREEILKMDYPEMIKVLDQEADSLILYINTYASNEPEFSSEKTGLSFDDLYEQAKLLKNTDVGNMRSLVNYYGLTDDAQSRLLYENVLLQRAGVISNKLMGAQYTAADIIQIYNNNSNYIFASGDTGSVNLEPVENQFYNELMEALIDKQTSYINAKYNQQDIQQAIAKLQAGSLAGTTYNEMTSEIKASTGTTLDRIDELKTQTREMAEEFYTNSIENRIYVSDTSYKLHSNGNILINFVIVAAFWFIVSFLYHELKQSSYNSYLEKIVQPFRRKRHGK